MTWLERVYLRREEKEEKWLVQSECCPQHHREIIMGQTDCVRLGLKWFVKMLHCYIGVDMVCNNKVWHDETIMKY